MPSFYHEKIENNLFSIPRLVDSFLSEPHYGATSKFHYEHCITRKQNLSKIIINKLLLAVAWGKESRAVAVDRPQTSGLYVQDLISKSPEFLLEKGNVTDWSGRTFNNITAFQYAVWALDFKMIKKMLKCIPMTAKGDRIRDSLLNQFIQMMTPINNGGGLTYTLVYDRPNVNRSGVPIKLDNTWQTTTVTETRTENHFDLTPIINAYLDFLNNLGYTSTDDRWVKGVGTQQKLLPFNILQRLLDPDTPLDPLPTFTGDFKRSEDIYHPYGGVNYGPTYGFFGGYRNIISIYPRFRILSELSNEYAILRGNRRVAYGRYHMETYLTNPGYAVCAKADVEAICKIRDVSIDELEKIKQQLIKSQHTTSECNVCVVQ